MTNMRQGAFALVLLCAGCASSPVGWDGRVRQWGTLREALHHGQTQGRVRLAEVVTKPHAYGLGALEDLAGEVMILDGAAWVSTVDEADGQRTSRAAGGDLRATILAVAYVRKWNDLPVLKDVPAAEFDDYVAAMGEKAGLNTKDTFPFVVQGPMGGVHVHIINGECPMVGSGQSRAGASAEPYRAARDAAYGTLVGFYAEGQAGVLTHHDSRTHVHAMLAGEKPLMGHVDAVALKAGAVLRMPAR